MKNKKILKNSAIIVSIIVLVIDILLYIKLKTTSSMIMQSKDSYETLGLLIGAMFQYSSLIYGFGLIIIVWIEYFLINFILKLLNKIHEFKKILLVSILSIIAIILFIIFIRVITFIFVFLM